MAPLAVFPYDIVVSPASFGARHNPCFRNGVGPMHRLPHLIMILSLPMLLSADQLKTAKIPAIDAAATKKFETATFAMG